MKTLLPSQLLTASCRASSTQNPTTATTSIRLRPSSSLSQWAIICIGSASCLFATEPLDSSPAAKLAAEARAFSVEMDARNLTSAQRIAARNEWLRTHESPLAAFHAERLRHSVEIRDTAVIVREALARQHAAIATKTGEERELAQLQWEVADAAREMREENVLPARRIAMFEEFLRVNRDVFSDISTLRNAISERQRVAAPAFTQSPPGSEAETRLRATREAILRELAAKRAALASLDPEERIAARERDRDFYRHRMDEFRENSKQTTEILRNQNNELQNR